jgi:hypothetical protein
VAAAYLIAEGLAKDAAEAVAMVRGARPEVVIGPSAMTALQRFADEQVGE